MESAQYIASPLDARKLMMRMVLRNGVVQAGLFLIFAGVHYAIEMVVPTDSLARSLLLQGTGFAWGVGVLAACAWSAATSHNCFVVNQQQAEYAARRISYRAMVTRWRRHGGFRHVCDGGTCPDLADATGRRSGARRRFLDVFGGRTSRRMRRDESESTKRDDL